MIAAGSRSAHGSGLVVRAAQAVHGIDQYVDIVRVDVLVNAMTQVEHMAAALTVCAQDPRNLLLDHRFWCVQHAGVEVALQGDFLPDLLPYGPDVYGPVQSNAIRARGGNFRCPGSAAFGKEDHGDALAFMRPDQAVDNFLHVGK